ncbi:MAG TPA: MFS transporter [Thermoanaerobaculia bacterium]|nr:MFS transporter [Thermoanaerobaculia bacterium]
MLNPWSGLKGLSARLWLLATATLINRAGTMVLAFLTLYLTKTQGYTAAQAGAFLALYGGVAIGAAPLAGRLCDRFGPLPVIVAGLLSNGLVLLAFPWAHGPWIVLATFAMAATNETTRPAALAAVTAWSAPEERRMGFALIRLAINLGVSIGPALGGFLATRSFRFLFWIDGATALAAGVVLLAVAARLGLTGRVVSDRQERAAGGAQTRPPGSDTLRVQAVDAPSSPAPADPRRRRDASPWTDGRFLIFLAVNLLVTMVFFQHNSTMALYVVQTLGLSTAIYGLMFTLNTLVIVLLEVPINAAMADWPFRRSLALGALLSGLGFGGLALVSSAWGVAATVLVWTFGEMILFPTAAAFSAHCAPPERQGAYMGLYSMSSAAAFALGPWAGTRLLAAWGGPVLWGIVFLCGLVAAGLFWRMAETAPPSRVSG